MDRITGWAGFLILSILLSCLTCYPVCYLRIERRTLLCGPLRARLPSSFVICSRTISSKENRRALRHVDQPPVPSPNILAKLEVSFDAEELASAIAWRNRYEFRIQ